MKLRKKFQVIGLIIAGALLLYSGGSLIGTTSALIWLIVAIGVVIWKISRRLGV